MFFRLATSLTFLFFALTACGPSVAAVTTPLVKPVPDTVTHVPVLDFAGLEPLLYTQSDSTFVVNFWAMWCAPCVKELPHFESFLEQHADEKTSVMLVSMDFPDDIEDKLLPFLNERRIYRSQVLLLDAPDANSWIDRVESTWSGAIPATLIFNRDTSVFFSRPFTDLADLEAAVSSINK